MDNNPDSSSRPLVDRPNPYLGRRVTVAGRVPLQVGVWPTLGEREARDVLVLLFCYTCATAGICTGWWPRRWSVTLGAWLS